MIMHKINIAKIQYSHYIAKSSQITLLICLNVIIGICSYLAMTEYMWATNDAQKAVKKAEADRQEVLDILSGKLVMIDKIDGKEQFAKIATVKWELVRYTK